MEHGITFHSRSNNPGTHDIDNMANRDSLKENLLDFRLQGIRQINYGSCMKSKLLYILNDTSNVTDRVFAIFSNLVCKTFKPKFQGSAKNI